MVVQRAYWLERIERAFRDRSVLWLTGVRRSGKTVLARSVSGAEWFDCERPSVRAELADPEAFLAKMRGKTAVLDEIHRLENPSELLKIAHDHYPTVRVLATGSSTIEATKKFSDKLTGRKASVWLTPMMSADLADFKKTDLRHRFRNGGLPPMFVQPDVPEEAWQDWLDSYWAKDVQAQFGLERRDAFQKMSELLMQSSGGMFEASTYAEACEVSRPTITSYLAVLEATWVVHIVRPYTGNLPSEIVKAPKVFGFDTGFISAYRGWREIRNDDLGILWEHYVLNEIHARTGRRDVQYWRDKRQHEVDFIWAPLGRTPVAIECKWKASSFDPAALFAFRRQHPEGENWLVAQDATGESTRRFGDVEVRVMGLGDLAGRVTPRRPRAPR